MSDDFNYQCRRRFSRRRPATEQLIVRGEELLGAGSGGGPGDGNRSENHEGTWKLIANLVMLQGEDRPLAESGGGTDRMGAEVGVVAFGDDPTKGLVNIKGNQGTRITSGPPDAPSPRNTSINGVEIQVGDEQRITLNRGVTSGNIESIEMNPGEISISSTTGYVSISAPKQIILTVADGLSQIILGPSGIIIKGLVVQIN